MGFLLALRRTWTFALLRSSAQEMQLSVPIMLASTGKGFVQGYIQQWLYLL